MVQVDTNKFEHKRGLSPVLWFDQMRMNALGMQQDGSANVVIFVAEAVIPDAQMFQEVARLVTTVEHAKKIADMICTTLNYQPNLPTHKNQ